MRGWSKFYSLAIFVVVLGLYISGAIISNRAPGRSFFAPLVALAEQSFGPRDDALPSPTPVNAPSPSPSASQKSAHPPSNTSSSNANNMTRSNSTATTTTIKPNNIGVYSTASPSDPTALANIDAVAGLGANVIYNYASCDGTPAEITRYLDYANSRGVKVIFSLKDYYDQLGANNYRDYNGYLYGNNNEEFALNIVRSFANHPATWGFAITDERPEGPWDMGNWPNILADRYRKIKAITTKPIMAVLVGHTSTDAGTRRNFLRNLRGSSDTFGLDYYPIPFMSTDKIAEIAQDMPAVGNNDGWFITQTFSWSNYPDTARGLGFNVSQARLPTSDEMYSMSATALNNGARNIMFYSYFDIAGNSAQLNALRSAIARLR